MIVVGFGYYSEISPKLQSIFDFMILTIILKNRKLYRNTSVAH